MRIRLNGRAQIETRIKYRFTVAALATQRESLAPYSSAIETAVTAWNKRYAEMFRGLLVSAEVCDRVVGDVNLLVRYQPSGYRTPDNVLHLKADSDGRLFAWFPLSKRWLETYLYVAVTAIENFRPD